MLGTNDLQPMHRHQPWHAAQGVAALVAAIRSAPIEPGMPVPPVLIVVPPAIATVRGDATEKFRGGAAKCEGLAAAYQDVAATLGCPCFDAGSVVTASTVDGVHLDADAHVALGTALAPVVRDLLRRV
jgi:lysophospholipase L1-like esterase